MALTGEGALDSLGELERFVHGLPESRRPRIVQVPEEPAADVAGLCPEIPYAQPLRRLGTGAVEVLFDRLPSGEEVGALQSRLGAEVAVAVADPAGPAVFASTRAMAAAGLAAGGRWLGAVLDAAARAGASDVRLGVGDVPIVKVGGVGWRRMTGFPVAGDAELEQAARWAASTELRAELPEHMDVDAAREFTSSLGRHRLRANVYRQSGGWAVSLRFIPDRPVPLDQLGLPPSVAGLAELELGLVLVVGATGSGKTTTLAALVDRINESRNRAIQTIENPVEFLHAPKRSSIHQREVGRDTASFAVAMRSAMRQNPDVILVGEIRDHEEIATAVTLAETGHLVFATLHTNSAAQTITRIVDAFPTDQQNQIRTQLSMSLKAVVCQHLFARLDAPGRGVVAAEVMIVNDPIAALIRRGEVDKVTGFILDGRREGMVHMDESLARLVVAGAVAERTARMRLTRPAHFDAVVQELRSGRLR